MNLITKIDNQEKKGWGIDHDQENDPTYPMRDRSQQSVPTRPEQQIAKIEVLQSIERQRYSAVIGETIPPSGWSGKLRRYAFQHSESRYRHWLPLLLADRVQEVEGLLDDLNRGKIPNLFVEMGGKALWKHDKRKLAIKMVRFTLGSLVVAALVKRLFK